MTPAPSEVSPPLTAVVEAAESAPKPEPQGDEFAKEQTSRWWVMYAVWIGAAIAVVVIVAIIRSSSPGSTPGSLPPASSTTTSVSSGSGATASTIAVGGAVLSGFTTASNNLDAANVVVTRALAGGRSQPVAQIAQEVAPYIKALQTFDFDLHLVTWPTALQVPSQDLQLRTQSLASFLSSISSANSATVGTWFAQFHALASETQTADNLFRSDIGLPETHTYP